LAPAGLIVMDFAVMAPTLLAGPTAVAHWPTTAAALVAAMVWVTAAEVARVTVMVLGLAALVEPAAPEPLRRTPLTRIVEPVTELTVPVALANARRAPELPVGAPVGAPEGAPEGRWAEPPPGKPPLAPVVGQAPLTFASMRAEVAVRACVEPATGVPVTVTQSPAVTWPVVTAVNLVAVVYVTVVWAVEDCTCRVPGDAAAISPEAPGMVGVPPCVPEFGAWVAAGAWVAVVALLLLPHAASTAASGMAATTAATWMRRRRVEPHAERTGTLAVIAVAPGLA
jgi:hypothetical protein